MSAPLQSWLEFPDGGRFELHGTVTLGRAPENGIVLDDEKVSRRHAILQSQEQEHWLVDLGSANGSYVNGRRVAQPVRLRSGDIIRLPGVELAFHSEILTAAHGMGRQMMASTMISVKTADCWMLMADIIGSTRLAQEVSTEQLPRITGQWFKSCREIIEAHQGHIMKYLGDGFFCYWESGPDSAEQVRRALADLHPMQGRGSPPFRIVLHHGAAALGSVPTMAELNLHGPQVNFTFRMEKVAAGLGLSVMLSEAARALLGTPCRQLQPCAVDGFSGTHQFHTTDL